MGCDEMTAAAALLPPAGRSSTSARGSEAGDSPDRLSQSLYVAPGTSPSQWARRECVGGSDRGNLAKASPWRCQDTCMVPMKFVSDRPRADSRSPLPFDCGSPRGSNFPCPYYWVVLLPIIRL